MFTAWRQWGSAKALANSVNKLMALEESNDLLDGKESKVRLKRVYSGEYPASSEATCEWKMLNGFYATMGGYAFDLDDVTDPSVRDVFGGATRLTLTARGAELLAKCGKLPPLSAGDINDKSKSDTIARLVVCFQAGWMIIQVLVRVGSGYPVSLLEVNTLGHVLCALVAYLLWWYKPKAIEEPTRLSSALLPLLAFMYMSSLMSNQRERIDLVHGKRPVPEAATVYYVESVQSPEIGVSTGSIYGSDENTLRRPETNPTLTRKESHQACGVFISRHGPLSTRFLPLQQSGRDQTQLRWQLASEAISDYPVLAERLVPTSDDVERDNRRTIASEELVVEHSLNWPGDDLLRSTHSLIMGMILWAVTILYGSVHMAAWNSYFPTNLEKWLWHASSIWVAFSGAVWVMIHIVAHVWKGVDELWVRFNRRQTHWTVDTIIVILCTICGLAYVFSRANLVIEAFVSLRRMPVAVYDTPSWVQVIPHL